LWFRHVVREIWPSTPRAMQAVARLKRTVLFSATAYGLCALAVVLFETVVEQTSADIARPMWWLGVFNVAMVVGFVTWLLGRPRRSQADVPGR
jgi:ABC-type nickel/cobalt efflux system permease component RcnA